MNFREINVLVVLLYTSRRENVGSFRNERTANMEIMRNEYPFRVAQYSEEAPHSHSCAMVVRLDRTGLNGRTARKS